MTRVWMKELRKEKGLTLKKLGEAVGLSECYLFNIEQGTRKCDGMDAAMLLKLADALKEKPQKLLQAEMDWLAEVIRDG